MAKGLPDRLCESTGGFFVKSAGFNRKGETKMIDSHEDDYKYSTLIGTQVEYQLKEILLENKIDCYEPLVDDKGIDLCVRKKDKGCLFIQIKSSRKNTFGGIKYLEGVDYFIFYRRDTKELCVMTTKEVSDKLGKPNKNGRRSITIPPKRFSKHTDIDFRELK